MTVENAHGESHDPGPSERQRSETKHTKIARESDMGGCHLHSSESDTAHTADMGKGLPALRVRVTGW